MAIFDNPLKPKKKKLPESNKDTAPDDRQSAITPDQLKNPIPRTPKQDIKFTKDPDTGRGNLTLGDGRSFTGLDPRDALKLAAGYRRSLEKTQFPTEQPVVPPVAQLPKPTDTVKDLGIGTIDPNLTNQTTTDILENQRAAALVAGLRTGDVQTSLDNPASIPLTSAPIGFAAGVAPKLTSVFISGKKDAFIKNLGLPRDVESYLSDYSNEGSFQKVKTDLETANQQISVAIDAVNAGDDVNNAIILYNAAQSRKALALRQYKLLSTDQKKYVAEVKEEMTKLETYYNGYGGVLSGKQLDDVKMANAVQKALMVQNG